jgi:hypothetical protein
VVTGREVNLEGDEASSRDETPLSGTMFLANSEGVTFLWGM